MTEKEIKRRQIKGNFKLINIRKYLLGKTLSNGKFIKKKRLNSIEEPKLKEWKERKRNLDIK